MRVLMLEAMCWALAAGQVWFELWPSDGSTVTENSDGSPVARAARISRTYFHITSSCRVVA